MKRSFLTGLGITDSEVIKQIIDYHQGVVSDFKDEIANHKLAVSDAQRELKDTLDTMTVDNDDFKAKYEKEVAAHTQTKEALTKKYDDFALETKNKEVIAAKQSILHRQLAADGANPKLIKLLEKEFDLAGIEIDGEGDKATIKGWDKLAEPVKAQYAEVFGKVESAGVTVSNPPPSQIPAIYTTDQIKNMTPAQINANWDKGVKQALEKGN